MATAKIGQRRAVDHGTGRCAQTIFQNCLGVGAVDGVHGVEAHAEFRALQEVGDALEIEQRFEQFGVVGHRVDDLDDHSPQLGFAQTGQIDVLGVEDTVLADFLRALVQRVGESLVGRAAVAEVVLDAEVVIRPAGVVAGREDDAAEGRALADHGAGCRGRQDAVLADHHAPETGGGGHAQDGLDGDIIEIAAITTEYQRLALEAFETVENRLDEVFEIARLAENLHFLAQSRSPRFLTGKRLAGNCFNAHFFSLTN